MEHKKLHDICHCLYWIYAVSMLMQFSLITMIVASLALIIALIITYAMRKKSVDTIYHSHIQWMLRTFWIGGGVYLPILTLIGFCIVYPQIDYTKLYDAMSSGQITDPVQLSHMLVEENKNLMIISLLVTTVPFGIWWLYRCWKGYKALKAGKAVENVMSWT